MDLGHNRGWLVSDAAASIKRIDAQIGHPLQITEAGRTYAQQLAHWLNFQKNGYPIALHPDTPSIHQLGAAIDTDERNVPVLNDNGWYQTVYRAGTLVEPWHFEYDPTRDNHINDTIPEEEEDMAASIIKAPNRPHALSVPGFFRRIKDDAELKALLAIGHRVAEVSTAHYDNAKHAQANVDAAGAFDDADVARVVDALEDSGIASAVADEIGNRLGGSS